MFDSKKENNLIQARNHAMNIIFVALTKYFLNTHSIETNNLYLTKQ